MLKNISINPDIQTYLDKLPLKPSTQHKIEKAIIGYTRKDAIGFFYRMWNIFKGCFFSSDWQIAKRQLKRAFSEKKLSPEIRLDLIKFHEKASTELLKGQNSLSHKHALRLFLALQRNFRTNEPRESFFKASHIEMQSIFKSEALIDSFNSLNTSPPESTYPNLLPSQPETEEVQQPDLGPVIGPQPEVIPQVMVESIQPELKAEVVHPHEFIPPTEESMLNTEEPTPSDEPISDMELSDSDSEIGEPQNEPEKDSEDSSFLLDSFTFLQEQPSHQQQQNTPLELTDSWIIPERTAENSLGDSFNLGGQPGTLFATNNGNGPTALGQARNMVNTGVNFVSGLLTGQSADTWYARILNNPGAQVSSAILGPYFEALTEKIGPDKVLFINDFFVSPAFTIKDCDPEQLEKHLQHYKSSIKPDQAIVIPLVIPADVDSGQSNWFLSALKKLGERNHIVTILIKDGTVEFYDSKGVVSQNVKLSDNWTLRTLLEKFESVFVGSKHPRIKENDKEHQTDCCNCGVFVSKFIHDRLVGKMTFNAIHKSDIPIQEILKFRQHMISVLDTKL